MSKTDYTLIDRTWVLHPEDTTTHSAKAPDPDYGQQLISPSRYFSSDEMRREWEGMWTKTWLAAGRVSDISEVGDYFTFDIGPESIIIVRVGPSEIAAFYNVCPHRGNKIVYNEFGHVSNFKCAFHSWQFSLNGQLEKLTDEELFHPDLTRCRPGLSPVKCDQWGGFVFINMDDEAEDLISFLGIIPEHLAPYHLEKYGVMSDIDMEWDANWKTGMDAFLEAYHSHAVHPEALPVYECKKVQYDCYPKGHSRQIAPWARVSSRVEHRPTELPDILADQLRLIDVDPETYDGPPDNIHPVMVQAKRKWGEKYGLDYFDELSDNQLKEIWSYQIFPNTTLNIQENGAMWQRWLPDAKDPEKMVYSIIMLFPPVNDPGKALIDLSNLGSEDAETKFDPTIRPDRIHATEGEQLGYLLNQDVQQIPRQQRGLRSRGFKGMRFGGPELRMRHYLAEIDSYLERSGV